MYIVCKSSDRFFEKDVRNPDTSVSYPGPGHIAFQ